MKKFRSKKSWATVRLSIYKTTDEVSTKITLYSCEQLGTLVHFKIGQEQRSFFFFLAYYPTIQEGFGIQLSAKKSCPLDMPSYSI